MSTKERLLARLEKCQGDYVSGETLAAEMGVSRNSVWKAARSLREEGYRIDAATNRGYALSFDSDRLSPSGIERCLRHKAAFSISVRKSVPSTNTWARERALMGDGEGTLVVAEGQSAGRGRRGRRFFSPEGSGIYLSIVLRPSITAEKSHLLTCAAAVACARAIELVSGKNVQVKWVNDIYCDGRKVAGILTEGSYCLEEGRFDYAVLGVGINVKLPEAGFPDEISARAGALFGADAPSVRCKLTAAFLDEFWELYLRLPDDSFRYEYRRRCFLLGESVTALVGGRKVCGRVVDIDHDFRLVLERPDGMRCVLRFENTSIQT